MVELSVLGPLAAFMASVTWAIGVLAYSKLSHDYPAYVVNLHRLMVGFPAACVMVTVLGGWGASFAAIDASLLMWAVVVVLSSYALGDALFLMATKHVGAPAALAIASIYPLWSALWGVFVDGHVLGVGKIFAILVIIGGVVAVILSGARRDELVVPVAAVSCLEGVQPRRRFWRESRFIGVMLALGASVGWAMNAVAVSKLGSELNAMFVNVLRLGIALLLCPIIGVAMNGRASFRLIPKKVFKPYFPAFAFECMLGPFFFVYGLSHSSLAVGAALSSLAPAISVPVAVMMGREKFSALKTLGVLGVVLGIWLLLA